MFQESLYFDDGAKDPNKFVLGTAGTFQTIWIGDVVPRTSVTSQAMRGFCILRDSFLDRTREFPAFVLTDLTRTGAREQVQKKYGYDDAVVDRVDNILCMRLSFPTNLTEDERQATRCGKLCPVFMCYTYESVQSVMLIALGTVVLVDETHVTIAVQAGTEHPFCNSLEV